MINLTAASPRHADSSVVDATAASSGSPLGGAGGEPSGASGVGGGKGGEKRLFSAMLASALGPSPRSAVAGARGNGLPVPPFQEREVGAGIRLITAEGAERPGEDALFAFAVSQGLDASLVASVLWPGMVEQATQGGAGIDGSPEGTADSSGADLGQVGQVPPAELVAALLAGTGDGRGGPVGMGAFAGASPDGGESPIDPALAGLADPLSPGAALGAFEDRLSTGTAGLPGLLAAGSAGFAAAAGELAGPGGVPASDGGQLLRAVLSAQNGATATAEGALVGGQTLGVALSAQNGATATAEDALVGGQPGRAADLGNGQSLAVMASLPGPAAPAGAQQSQTAALDRQAMALPTVDALRRAGGSGPAAESGNPLFPAAAALRLSEAKGQIRFATEAASSMLSAAGASTSASYANLPAQWVLTGAGPGGLIGTDADEAGPDNLVDTGVLSGVDGEAVAAPDAGHKQHANRAASTATDPIDLSGEGGRGASAADADSENSLAKRLAEGLAQRMLAAASSNNWKMQIDLKPAHLGRISVEMSMQQGQLEAVFDAGQASARQLISEGLDRLRQDLQRAGMNVAHLGLNFGSGAGTGGKPTPRGREGQSDQGAAGAVQGVSTAASGSRSRAGSDGLDVMV